MRESDERREHDRRDQRPEDGPEHPDRKQVYREHGEHRAQEEHEADHGQLAAPDQATDRRPERAQEGGQRGLRVEDALVRRNAVVGQPLAAVRVDGLVADEIPVDAEAGVEQDGHDERDNGAADGDALLVA